MWVIIQTLLTRLFLAYVDSQTIQVAGPDGEVYYVPVDFPYTEPY